MDLELRERQNIIKEVFIETGEYEEVYNEPHNNFIIVECEHGHRYKLDYKKYDFEVRVRKGCPFCKGYSHKILSECSYNVNALTLEYLMNTIPEAEVLNNYVFLDLKYNVIPTSELTICSSTPLKIRVKEGREDTLGICRKRSDWYAKEYYINTIGLLFLLGILGEFKPRKGIYEKVREVRYCGANYYTYYYCDNDRYFYTKELLDIEEQYEFIGMALFDGDMKEVNPELNKLMNEPDIKKRMKIRGIRGQVVKIYKFNKDKKNSYILNKDTRELVNTLKIEECKIVAKKKHIEKEKRELQRKENKILEELTGIQEKLRKLMGKKEYIDINMSLYDWCLQPENQELGNIIINQFLPRKNKLSLSEIPFDSDEVIYIKSSHGTTFETTPRTITHDKKVLPKLPRGTSYPELFIFYYMESIYPEAIHRGKAYGTVEYDITIPEKKACIEYNGSAFHKGKYARPEVDANKLELCKKKGVKYIRIEDDGDTFAPKIKDWLVTIKYEESRKQEQLMLLCKRIVKKYFHSNKQDISLEEIEKKIRLYY